VTALATADRGLFAPGRADRLAQLRTGLAVVTLLRIVTWPFPQLAGAPLFRPAWFLAWADHAPGATALIAIQVVGAAAAATTIAVSRRGDRSAAWPLRVAWLCLLVLGGYKTSTGKILHNDVLLLLATAPVLLCRARAGLGDRRTGAAYGWPLRASLATVAFVYLLCGLQKLRHSGLAWVFSDNFRWVLADGVASGRAPMTLVASTIAGSAALSVMAAAGLLAFELSFPLVLRSRGARIPFAAGAVVLHTMTWLTLGLDYWAWSLTAGLVLVLSALERGHQLERAA
jgi:hypothetical protein